MVNSQLPMPVMRPTNITADKTQKLLKLTWGNGRTSALSFKLLSDMCPCELCTMEREERNSTNPLKILRPKSDELEAISAVGNYGVSIMWKGGCRYGIYTWEFLGKLG
jgi:DUF971 family protein